jgi:hypothetical protein
LLAGRYEKKPIKGRHSRLDFLLIEDGTDILTHAHVDPKTDDMIELRVKRRAVVNGNRNVGAAAEAEYSASQTIVGLQRSKPCKPCRKPPLGIWTAALEWGW